MFILTSNYISLFQKGKDLLVCLLWFVLIKEKERTKVGNFTLSNTSKIYFDNTQLKII